MPTARVFKYPLRYQETAVPCGKVLKVDFQLGQLFAWVEVAPGHVTQQLTIVPTGEEVPPNDAQHVGTAVSDHLVWHVYRRNF